MKLFRLDELDAERAANDGAYLRFLREPRMSAGLYALSPATPIRRPRTPRTRSTR